MSEIRVEQHFKERATAMDGDGGFTEIRVTYIVTGTEEEEEALRAVHERTPDKREELPLDALEITRREAPDIFLVEVTYRNRTSSWSPGKEDEEEATVSFDCGGGSRHMTHSYDQRRVYGEKNAGGAIGWNGKSGAEMAIAGIDVPTAQLRETYSKVMRLSRITTAFKRKVAKLVGKVNSCAFKGWNKGEVMFLGMSYSSPAKRSTKVNVVFNFAIQPNEEVTICGKKISKNGFEYAWGLSRTEADENGVPRAVVDAIYVDEVCRYDSFSALGL